jgi:DNA-binding MarR family transcriptional regulator
MDRASRAVEQWRRERPDIDGTPMLVLGRLAEAAQRVGTERLAPFFAAHGLQRGDFDVLATLRRAGDPYALTPTALYEATMVTSGAMTGRIDRLEAAGLAERRPDPSDRRGVLVALTPAGLELIDRILPLHVENQRAALAGLTRAEQEALGELLGRLIAGLDGIGGGV